MIEHQLEALQSEAWGVSGEEYTLDYARRVREFLEAQEFETGLGSLDMLPDIVQHVCGHAEAIERRRAEPIPWQNVLRDYLDRALEMDIKEKMLEVMRYPYFGPFLYANPQAAKSSVLLDYAVNDIIRAGNKEEDKTFAWELVPPLSNRICIIGDSSGSVSPEDAKVFLDEMPADMGGPPGIPIVNKEERTVEWHQPEGTEEMGHHRKVAMHFIDEFVLAPPHILEAINVIKEYERDNGDQSERND